MPPVFPNAVSCSRSPQPSSAGFWEPGLVHAGKFPSTSADGSGAACGSSTPGVPSLGSVLGAAGLPRLLTAALAFV